MDRKTKSCLTNFFLENLVGGAQEQELLLGRKVVLKFFSERGDNVLFGQIDILKLQEGERGNVVITLEVSFSWQSVFCISYFFVWSWGLIVKHDA